MSPHQPQPVTPFTGSRFDLEDVNAWSPLDREASLQRCEPCRKLALPRVPVVHTNMTRQPPAPSSARGGRLSLPDGATVVPEGALQVATTGANYRDLHAARDQRLGTRR
jgi:hypothetical protein